MLFIVLHSSQTFVASTFISKVFDFTTETRGYHLQSFEEFGDRLCIANEHLAIPTVGAAIEGQPGDSGGVPGGMHVTSPRVLVLELILERSDSRSSPLPGSEKRGTRSAHASPRLLLCVHKAREVLYLESSLSLAFTTPFLVPFSCGAPSAASCS